MSLGRTNDLIPNRKTKDPLEEPVKSDLHPLTQGPHTLATTATESTGAADRTTGIPPETTDGPTNPTEDNRTDNQYNSASPGVARPATHASPRKSMTSRIAMP